MKRFVLALALFTSPAFSDTTEAVGNRILPGLAGFADATDALNDVAQTNCTPDALKGPYNAAFDAWMRIADVRLGPSEERALSISFWPDKRGFTQSKLTELIAEKDPIVAEPEDFAEISIAARGFFALERMLYDPEFANYGEDSYSCSLTRAIARDLATQAAALDAAWQDFAPTLLNPGADNNTTYLDESEAVRAIYTQAMSSLELTADTRLGRPLGEPARPRPTRAEAWRSGRSLTNVMLATEAAYNLAVDLADWDMPESAAAMERVRKAADEIEDPSFQNIDDLVKRLKLEILQQEIDGLENALEVEFGARLGIQPGFNSSDGD